MQPNRFLQSDNKQIIKLARRAIGGTKDAAGAVKKIEAFVGDYIENKSLSVGYASAVEVAASRQGDCTEHAVLVAAMCRAVGIPGSSCYRGCVRGRFCRFTGFWRACVGAGVCWRGPREGGNPANG